MRASGDREMGRFSVEFTLVNLEDAFRAKAGDIADAQVRRKTLRGVVDTGATRLVLPESVATELGLPLAGEATVKYADQRTGTRKMVDLVRLELLGRHGVFNAILEPDRTDALIGAIVLEDLDLVVDCVTQKLHPRDPQRIVSEIECC